MLVKVELHSEDDVNCFAKVHFSTHIEECASIGQSSFDCEDDAIAEFLYDLWESMFIDSSKECINYYAEFVNNNEVMEMTYHVEAKHED